MQYPTATPARSGHEHTNITGLLDDVDGFATTMKAGTFGFLTFAWV